jgi:hypothetical protein
MPDVGDDPRFLAAMALINAHDYAEAGEIFEDLFFEAIVGEVEFVRVFLQLTAGAHHLERGSSRAAIARLREGLLALARVRDTRGWDLGRLRADVEQLIDDVAAGRPFRWPEVFRL